MTDPSLQNAIAYIMGDSVATPEPQEGHSVATEGPQQGHNVPTLHPIHVRLSEGDYSALGAIAERDGTTRAALIRKAVKQLIRSDR